MVRRITNSIRHYDLVSMRAVSETLNGENRKLFALGWVLSVGGGHRVVGDGTIGSPSKGTSDISKSRENSGEVRGLIVARKHRNGCGAKETREEQ